MKKAIPLTGEQPDIAKLKLIKALDDGQLVALVSAPVTQK
jgi:hypothetical protein